MKRLISEKNSKYQLVKGTQRFNGKMKRLWTLKHICFRPNTFLMRNSSQKSFSLGINSFNPNNHDGNINQSRLLLFYYSNYCTLICDIYGMVWMSNTNLNVFMTSTLKHSIFELKSLCFFTIHVDISSRKIKNNRWMPGFISRAPNFFFLTTYFSVFTPLTCLIS